MVKGSAGRTVQRQCTILTQRRTPPPRRQRSVVEQYMGKAFQAFQPLPEWKFEDYLGWHEQV